MNKEITFYEIFHPQIRDDKVIDCIEIPMIQRDYAQGRESNEVTRIRKQFLSALYSALTDNNEPAKLDFVYGNISDGKLILLDGQQRLTTLFLLHWYIAKKDNISRDKYRFLDNFTYRTRFSSTHFCENIMNSTPEFSGDKLSDWIEDQSWYMYSWDHDPTICSMLVVLNDIHTTFKNESDLWGKITRVKDPLISFYFLPLEDMGLTDSLYIKMNSRGKPLTNFEHFKAEFEDTIKNVSAELYLEFTQKVDRNWVDMLWKYRGEDNSIDDEFMRYFRFVTEALCFENDIDITENDFDLAFNVYSTANINAEENLKFLFKAFDCWIDIGDIKEFFNNVFSSNSYEEGKVVLYSDSINLFHECCIKYGMWSGRRRDFTLNNTILLYGTLTYLINKEKISQDEFKERIRIIRNLVMNSPDEIRDDRMKAILVDTKTIMLEKQVNLKNLSFNEIQKKQEINKIDWRIQQSELTPNLNELEDHFLLRGSVAVIGLDESEKLKQRVKAFYSIFQNKPNYIKISRALLTIQDYSQLHSWRFLFGDSLDKNWRELFTESKQRKHFDRTKSTLLNLLDSIGSQTNTDKYLDDLISAYLGSSEAPKDWKYYFIKYPKMREGQNGRYYWYDDSGRKKENQYKIIMMNTPSTLNGRHWDPFLYEVVRDEILKETCSLEDYSASLVIKSQNTKVKCTNSSWLFCDHKGTVIYEEKIPQKDGIDSEDRVELLKAIIKKRISLVEI